jgi:hypothetical protein
MTKGTQQVAVATPEQLHDSRWVVEFHVVRPGEFVSGVIHRDRMSFAFEANIRPFRSGDEPGVDAAFEPRNALSAWLYDEHPDTSRELFGILMRAIMSPAIHSLPGASQ